jgi:4-aminobutyrate aminotransferase/(S)-3-amino-2-methylpropionate transaminase
VQAGFARTGRMFAYEHYGITPDLIACGKGITSSLPLSAVIGRSDVMELYPPGSMTSTHSASPLAVEAALANLQVIREEGLVARSEHLGRILLDGLHPIQARHCRRLGCLWGKGLVAGLQVVQPGTKIPDPDTATRVNVSCFRKGLLMFAPVGVAGECLKICPPLVISEDALRESIAVFGEACDEVLAGE